MSSLSLVIGALWCLPAAAATRIDVSEMSVDGLAVHDLICELDSGGFLAAASVVGALAKVRDGVAKCGPAGEAARVSFQWKGKKTSAIKVIGASKASVGACVAKVLARVVPAQTGSCTATLLTADNAAGKKAAAALSPRKATEEAKPSEPPEKAKPSEAPEPEPDWQEFYSDDNNWNTLSNKSQGWLTVVPKGAAAEDAWIEKDGVTWRGAVSKHDHQLLLVFWHPTAPLTAETLEWIDTKMGGTLEDAKWRELKKIAAKDDFPETLIETTTAKGDRYVRIAAHWKHGSYVILAAFGEGMPDKVVTTWLNEVSFFVPE